MAIEQTQDKDISLEIAEKVMFKAMLCDVAARGLYSTLKLNSDWVALKALGFTDLDQEEVRSVFNGALEVCAWSEAVMKDVRRAVDQDKFDEAFEKLHPFDKDIVYAGMISLVEEEFDWSMLDRIPSDRAIEEMAYLRLVFRNHEKDLRDELYELTGILGEPGLDSSSLPVNFPDPQKAELIWEELYAEICDPHPRAYVFDFNTLRKGLIAAEAFSRIVEEDRLLGNEVAGDAADTEN